MKPIARLVWITTALAVLAAVLSLVAMLIFDYTSPLYRLTQILPLLTLMLHTWLAFALIPLVNRVYQGSATAADTRTAWLALLIAVGVLFCICAPGIIMMTTASIDF